MIIRCQVDDTFVTFKFLDKQKLTKFLSSKVVHIPSVYLGLHPPTQSSLPFCHFALACSSLAMGNSRKYPYPTTDSFHVLTPPHPSLPLEFHNRKPPLPFGISAFFWKFIFDLATPISTNEHEFMPPQGCDPVAPGDKLYSSATRKTYHVRPGCATSLSIWL